MVKAHGVFHKCVQNSQEVGRITNDKNHMFSRIYFTLEVNGKKYENMYVDISQPYGTDYTKEPIEVHPPQGGYSGPFNHHAFSEAVESYYRSAIGEQGKAICFSPNTAMVMLDNIIEKVSPFEFEITV